MVKVYTMSNCPFCEAAKMLLKQRGVEFSEVKLGMNDDDAWDALYAKSKMKTVPQIFAGDRLVGGFTELSTQDRADKLASLMGA